MYPQDVTYPGRVLGSLAISTPLTSFGVLLLNSTHTLCYYIISVKSRFNTYDFFVPIKISGYALALR